MKCLKHTLTEEEVKWLGKHFRNTKNAELAARLGISESSVHRYARELGLKKTPQFIRKCQTATALAAKESHIRNGTYPPKGYRIPRSEEFQFKPGVTPLQRHGKRKEEQRIRNLTASLAATRKLERARALFGLERKTKLRIAGMGQPRHFAEQRHYLRKLGYLIERGSMDAYYTPDTKRSEDYESRTRDNCNKYAPFRFKPAKPDGFPLHPNPTDGG